MLHVDIGCTPTYVWRARHGEMLIDELIRKTVVFLGREAYGTFTPYGTGTLCAYEGNEGISFMFVATAKHVLDDIRGDAFWARINRTDGTCATVKVEKQYFNVEPESKETDLILFSIVMDVGLFDCLFLPINRTKFGEAFKDAWEASIGDEVCVTGLYTSHYGNLRNIPIVRVGHLAALPEEPVATDRGYVEGYLIELHSIAGLSGSPVFVSPPPIYRDKQGEIKFRHGSVHLPLGILIGHHVIESKEDEIVVPKFQKASAAPDPLYQKNTGFGVVIPLERLLEMCERPDVQSVFADAAKVKKAKSGFVPDASVSTERAQEEGNPEHKEDFRRLLNAAAKTREQED